MFLFFLRNPAQKNYEIRYDFLTKDLLLKIVWFFTKEKSKKIFVLGGRLYFYTEKLKGIWDLGGPLDLYIKRQGCKGLVGAQRHKAPWRLM